MALTKIDTDGPKRVALTEIRFIVAARMISRHSAAVAYAEIGGHTVELCVPFVDGAPDAALMATMDQCCNGDWLRAFVQPLPSNGHGYRRLELITLAIDFAGFAYSAGGIDGPPPILWSAEDGVEPKRAANGEQDHGQQTEADAAEAQQAEG